MCHGINAARVLLKFLLLLKDKLLVYLGLLCGALPAFGPRWNFKPVLLRRACRVARHYLRQLLPHWLRGNAVRRHTDFIIFILLILWQRHRLVEARIGGDILHTHRCYRCKRQSLVQAWSLFLNYLTLLVAFRCLVIVWSS